MRPNPRQLLGGETRLHDHDLWSEPIAFALDRAPTLLARADDVLPACRDGSERVRLQYDTVSRPDVVNVRGLRVLWALGATADVVLVPGSHKTDSAYPAPSLQRMDAAGATVSPALAPGDALLCAATTLVGRRGSAGGGRGAATVISDCHFAVPLNHFMPGFLSHSVAVF